MTRHNEPGGPSAGRSAGAKLVALALVLVAIAVAADLTWMLPHPGPVANPERLPSPSTPAADAPAPTPYAASSVKLHTEGDAKAPPF